MTNKLIMFMHSISAASTFIYLQINIFYSEYTEWAEAECISLSTTAVSYILG